MAETPQGIHQTDSCKRGRARPLESGGANGKEAWWADQGGACIKIAQEARARKMVRRGNTRASRRFQNCPELADTPHSRCSRRSDSGIRSGRLGNCRPLRQKRPRKSIELFRVLRDANLALLKSLTPEQWKHYGMHAERGEESIEQIVRMFAGHDINHTKQIEKIFSAKKS